MLRFPIGAAAAARSRNEPLLSVTIETLAVDELKTLIVHAGFRRQLNPHHRGCAPVGHFNVPASNLGKLRRLTRSHFDRAFIEWDAELAALSPDLKMIGVDPGIRLARKAMGIDNLSDESALGGEQELDFDRIACIGCAPWYEAVLARCIEGHRASTKPGSRFLKLRRIHRDQRDDVVSQVFGIIGA